MRPTKGLDLLLEIPGGRPSLDSVALLTISGRLHSFSDLYDLLCRLPNDLWLGEGVVFYLSSG